VDLDHARTGQRVYLLQRWTRVAKAPPSAAEAAAAAAPPTKMALGVAGGFALDDAAAGFEVLKEHALVVLPSRAALPYPHPGLPPAGGHLIEIVVEVAKDDVAMGINQHRRSRLVMAGWREVGQRGPIDTRAHLGWARGGSHSVSHGNAAHVVGAGSQHPSMAAAGIRRRRRQRWTMGPRRWAPALFSPPG
jgi:hypothetical protein